MKTINVYFEDPEFEDLIDLKGKRSWHDFILELAYGDKYKDDER